MKSHRLKRQGTTPSERYLSLLCKRSFLSLWSYSNLYTDQGKSNNKGDGKELCDLLVVFGNDVIIFSDKNISFNQGVDINVAWKRWYKKAVLKSANQVFGAENWIHKFPNRIYLDSKCQKKFPLQLPSSATIKIHRVCVALGASNACANYYKDKNFGSLVLDPSLKRFRDHNDPFIVGQPNVEKGFVHVFNDSCLDLVFRERDTITDFIAYLTKREDFLSKGKLGIRAFGEEQILAIYLRNLNLDEEHDFILGQQQGSLNDIIEIQEGFWEKHISSKQYRVQKKANEISYLWDALIEQFIQKGQKFDDQGFSNIPITDIEIGLRFLASESRLRRRILSETLTSFLKKARNDEWAARVVIDKDNPDIVYVFLMVAHNNVLDYNTNIRYRQTFLLFYCQVVRGNQTKAKYIIGVGLSPHGTRKSGEDLVVLDARFRSEDQKILAIELQEKYGLQLDKNILKTNVKYQEYPDFQEPKTTAKNSHPNAKRQAKKKKNKRKMIKQSRKRNRK